MEATAAKRIAPPFDESIFEDPVTPEINRREPRFFIQYSQDELSVDTQAIPKQKLYRGIPTPCLSYQQIAPKIEIREGDRIPGSEVVDKDGKVYLMSYWRYAGDEATRLIELENHPNNEYRTGLREIVSLRGNLRLFRRAQLDTLFYKGLDALPELNSDMISLLEQRVRDLERMTPPAGVTPEELDIIHEVGKEMLECARESAEIQLRRLEFIHSCMKLPPSDSAHVKVYSDEAEMLLRRTGMKRIHHVDQATASALEILASKSTDNASNGEMKELISLMKTQMESMQRTIEGLLNERAEKNTKRGGN